MAYVRKIINDPVYGFITVDDPLIFEIISHPYYQRLRRIHQMAFASLVYPGAVHTRLHHSLGAYHLMGLALSELRNKGVEITRHEEQAAKIAYPAARHWPWTLFPCLGTAADQGRSSRRYFHPYSATAQ
jgi:hypothetical protein